MVIDTFSVNLIVEEVMMRAKRVLCCLWLIGCLILVTATMAESALLVFDDTDTYLLGARDVTIGDISYDVSFVGGTTRENYGDSWIFDFTTYTEATQAANALLDQVFSPDSPQDYDTNPGLINGVYPQSPGSIFIHIPYLHNSDWNISTAYLQNDVSETYDRTGPMYVYADSFSYRGNPPEIFARFTPAAVPVPSSLIILAAGVLTMAGVCRRKK